MKIGYSGLRGTMSGEGSGGRFASEEMRVLEGCRDVKWVDVVESVDRKVNVFLLV